MAEPRYRTRMELRRRDPRSRETVRPELGNYRHTTPEEQVCTFDDVLLVSLDVHPQKLDLFRPNLQRAQHVVEAVHTNSYPRPFEFTHLSIFQRSPLIPEPMIAEIMGRQLH